MSKKIIGVIASIALVLSLVGAQASAFTASDIAVLKAIFGSSLTATQSAALDALVSPATATVATASSYTFTKDLTIGSKGADVTALQKVLVSQGDLVMPAGVAYGYFGALTKTALAKYQSAMRISPAAGYFGPITRARVNASAGSVTTTTGTTTVPTGTSLSVALAPTSPSMGAIVAGQAIADLVEYTFTNTSASPAVVTNVTLQRGGVSNDSALAGVYLYNGVNRLTDAAAISQGVITFNAPSGLFTIPAGSSMTIAVRADIATVATNGAVIGQLFVISLTGVTASIPVSAVFPVAGASQQLSSVALSGITVASSTPATSYIDPQTDYVMWQGSVNVINNNAWLKAIALREVGSVSTGDISNFRFFVDGTQVGPVLTSYDANGYLTFDFSASPIKVTTGSHTVKLVGDIIGGSTKYFSFSLRQASDINIVDSQLNVNVLAEATGGFPLTSGQQNINAGNLTVTKTTDSPSGNVVLSSTGVALARYTLQASGEPVKIENLNVLAIGPGLGTIRNGALFANGAQVGSTASIGTTTATQFNLGSSLVVYPGSPVTLEVRGDIYTDSGPAMANGNTITISLQPGSSNADLQKSLGQINVPDGSAVAGNQITVAQGTLSLSKYTGYSNQTVVVPSTAKLIGSYTLTAGTSEDLNLNTIDVNLLGAGASTTATSTNITNMYITFGDINNGGKTSSVKSTVTSGDNQYSVNYLLPAGQTQTINVYATLNSNLGALDVVSTKLSVTGQTSKSFQTVEVPLSGFTQGQTISVTTGQLNLGVYNLQSDANVVAGNLVKAGSYKFVATGDSFTVDRLIGSIPFTSAGNVSGIVYKIGNTVLNNGGTSIDTSNNTSAIATTTGLSIVVPANSSAGVVVDAYVQLSQVGTPNNATSSSDVIFTLNGYRQISSNGVQTQVGNLTLAGNNQYAYASVPTITTATLPNGTVLSNGDVTLARINIAADSNGAIDWSSLAFNVNTSNAAIILGQTTPWKLVPTGSSVAIAGTMATTGSQTAQVVKFIPTNIQQIGAGTSKSYDLVASVSGATTGYSISTKIAQGATSHAASTASTTAATVAGTATFVWSDESYNTTMHSATTPDWNNDWLVQGIPTNSQTQTN